MSRELIGLIIAGVIPAFLFSASGLLQKLSMKKGATFEYSTSFMGLGMLLMCILFFIVPTEKKISTQSALVAISQGMVFALGVGLVSIGMFKSSDILFRQSLMVCVLDL